MVPTSWRDATPWLGRAASGPTHLADQMKTVGKWSAVGACLMVGSMWAQADEARAKMTSLETAAVLEYLSCK